MTERKARVRASLAFSSSRRWTCSKSGAGLGVERPASSSSSNPLVTCTPGINAEAAGTVTSTGRKLRRLAERGVGLGAREVGDNRPADEGRGGGDCGSMSRNESLAVGEGLTETSGIGGGGYFKNSDCKRSLDAFLDNDGEIVPPCNKVPVVDIRTSICGVVARPTFEPGDDTDLAAGRV